MEKPHFVIILCTKVKYFFNLLSSLVYTNNTIKSRVQGKVRINPQATIEPGASCTMQYRMNPCTYIDCVFTEDQSTALLLVIKFYTPCSF